MEGAGSLLLGGRAGRPPSGLCNPQTWRRPCCPSANPSHVRLTCRLVTDPAVLSWKHRGHLRAKRPRPSRPCRQLSVNCRGPHRWAGGGRVLQPRHWGLDTFLIPEGPVVHLGRCRGRTGWSVLEVPHVCSFDMQSPLAETGIHPGGGARGTPSLRPALPGAGGSTDLGTHVILSLISKTPRARAIFLCIF